MTFSDFNFGFTTCFYMIYKIYTFSRYIYYKNCILNCCFNTEKKVVEN